MSKEETNLLKDIVDSDFGFDEVLSYFSYLIKLHDDHDIGDGPASICAMTMECADENIDNVTSFFLALEQLTLLCMFDLEIPTRAAKLLKEIAQDKKQPQE